MGLKKDWGEFWRIVEMVHKDRDKFWSILRDMNREQMILFYSMYSDSVAELKCEPFIERMGEEPSEDVVDDIANWIVKQGEEYFYGVLEDPDLIGVDIDSEVAKDSFDPRGAVMKIYEDKYKSFILENLGK